MTKKILILGDYPLPNEIINGGIMRSVYLTANALSHLYPEYDFHVLTITDGVAKSYTITTNNLTIHYIAFPLRNKPILVPKFLYKQFILKEINKINPDLIHASGTSWEYGYPAVDYKRCPILITVHGISHNESKYWIGIKNKWHKISCCYIESYVLERAKNIVCVSSYVAKEIQRDATIISNPIDPKFFNIINKPIKTRLLYVGGIEERKGLDVLIQSLFIVKKQIPDIMLHIVGPIRNINYYKTVIDIIYDLKLIYNVDFKGKISDFDLTKEYSNALIYISPSFEESEGITILEAMATGTPVIATRSGGSESIIKDGFDGMLVEKGDVCKLAVKILERGKDMGEAGKMSARKYLPENIARQYMGVYKRVL